MARETPNEWHVASLGEITESAVDGPFGSNLKTEHYVSKPGIRVVRLQNIGNGEFNGIDKAWISEVHARTLGRHEVRAGDILVASLGDENHPFARACLYPSDHAPGIVKADCFRLRAAKELAFPGFIMRALNCASLRDDLRALAQGVTRDRVNLGNLLRFRIPLPPVGEQKRISAILDAVDEAILQNEQLVAKLKQMKQGLLHDLLTRGIDDNGELRDPERHPEQFQDSSLGLIPRAWTVSPLGQQLTLQRGFDITAAEQRHGDVPVVSSSGITSYHDKAMVHEPGVITGRKGRLGAVFYVNVPFWPHDTTLWVRDFHGNHPKFGAILLGSLRLERFDAATSVPTLNRNFIHPMLVAMPPALEQKAISDRVEVIDTGIADEVTGSAKLRLIKQGLMEDLLTGRVRVTDLATTP